MGIYNAHVLEVLYQEGFPLWLEASIQIKQAGGLQRGNGAARRSDAIDAVRIAEYAYRFRDRLRIWHPTHSVLKQLTELSQLRHRLQSAINQLAVPLTEQKRFGDPALQCQLKNHCGDSLKALRKNLEQVEVSLKSLIQHDTELKTLFTLLTSIPGVGTVVATEIVIATAGRPRDEFKAIAEPKKLACHAGVAPFEHRSGSSVRGRTRVNHHAASAVRSKIIENFAPSSIHGGCQK